MIAYCYRSGQIRFGRKVPEGAIPVAQGPAKPLRELIRRMSRHAYDGTTLLVPGIPEAETEDQAESALMKFIAWIAPQVAELKRWPCVQNHELHRHRRSNRQAQRQQRRPRMVASVKGGR